MQFPSTGAAVPSLRVLESIHPEILQLPVRQAHELLLELNGPYEIHLFQGRHWRYRKRGASPSRDWTGSGLLLTTTGSW
jgi:hypothetical protein